MDQFPLLGMILAGGEGRRLGGGGKALRPFRGTPILAQVLTRFAPQVPSVFLNANDDPARFADFHVPVVADATGELIGPLGGLLAGLDHAAACLGEQALLAVVPVDSPFLPVDLVARLADAAEQGRVAGAVASSGGRVHPVFGVWRVGIREVLRDAVGKGGLRRMTEWLTLTDAIIVDWPVEPVDPFTNMNTPEDWAKAESFWAEINKGASLKENLDRC